jgi:hypothetical protein
LTDFDNWHAAPLPIDEAKRVLLLRSLAVLVTPHVAIALVSLVDEHQQWFKSRVGQDICEIPPCRRHAQRRAFQKQSAGERLSRRMMHV